MVTLVLLFQAAPPAQQADTKLLLLFASVLLLFGIGLFLLEFFIPSFGLISVLALACAAGSIWAAFRVDELTGSELYLTGWTFVLLNVALIPTVVVVGFKLMRSSPLVVRSVIDGISISDERARELQALTGQQGSATTPLRPSGTARLGGAFVSVQTNGEFVESGTLVEVVDVEGNRVYVKPVKP